MWFSASTRPGEEKPLRHIEGDDTGLDTPHGIAVDEKDRLLFVNNWGHHSNFMVQGTGKFFPPSIKVYSLDASGDAKPLRVITGDKTQLDWPAAMKFNPENGDLYVANDIGQSVLVFANAPTRKGRRGAGPGHSRAIDATAQSHREWRSTSRTKRCGSRIWATLRPRCIR